MVLPVKISIDKVTHLAHTIDITQKEHGSARSERHCSPE